MQPDKRWECSICPENPFVSGGADPNPASLLTFLKAPFRWIGVWGGVVVGVWVKQQLFGSGRAGSNVGVEG